MNGNNKDILVQESIDFKGQFTTVTTFSKYLAVALFIALPFVGFFVGRHYFPLIVEEEVVFEDLFVPLKVEEVTKKYPTPRERFKTNQYYITDTISHRFFDLFGGTLDFKSIPADSENWKMYLVDQEGALPGGFFSLYSKPTATGVREWRPVDLLWEGGMDYSIRPPESGEYKYLLVHLNDPALEYECSANGKGCGVRSFGGYNFDETTLSFTDYSGDEVSKDLVDVYLSELSFEIINHIPS